MLRRPPRSTRTDTLFPYTTLLPISPWCRCKSLRCLRDSTLVDGGRVLFGHRPGRGEQPRAVDRVEFIRLAAEITGDAHFALLGQDVLDFALRSEEHTSELQSLMRISYAVFCLKKKKKPKHT